MASTASPGSSGRIVIAHLNAEPAQRLVAESGAWACRRRRTPGCRRRRFRTASMAPVRAARPEGNSRTVVAFFELGQGARSGPGLRRQAAPAIGRPGFVIEGAAEGSSTVEPRCTGGPTVRDSASALPRRGSARVEGRTTAFAHGPVTTDRYPSRAAPLRPGAVVNRRVIAAEARQRQAITAALMPGPAGGDDRGQTGIDADLRPKGLARSWRAGASEPSSTSSLEGQVQARPACGRIADRREAREISPREACRRPGVEDLPGAIPTGSPATPSRSRDQLGRARARFEVAVSGLPPAGLDRRAPRRSNAAGLRRARRRRRDPWRGTSTTPGARRTARWSHRRPPWSPLTRPADRAATANSDGGGSMWGSVLA